MKPSTPSETCERCHHGPHETGMCVFDGCVCNVGPWDRPKAPPTPRFCEVCLVNPVRPGLRECDFCRNGPSPPGAKETCPTRCEGGSHWSPPGSNRCYCGALEVTPPSPPAETPRMDDKKFAELVRMKPYIKPHPDIFALVSEAVRARSGEQYPYRDLVAALAEVDKLKAKLDVACEAYTAAQEAVAALKERCEKLEEILREAKDAKS
jgi:hypothetical protein